MSTLLLLAAAPATAATSQAERARADAAYARGIELYESGLYADAAAQFEEAYTVVGDKLLLWNVGRSWERAGELDKARTAYEELLAHPRADAKMRAKVADALVRVGATMAARKAARTYEQKAAQLAKEIAAAEREKNTVLVQRLQAQLESERAAREAEAKRADEARKADDARKTAAARKAEQARQAEKARKAQEVRRAEEARRAIEDPTPSRLDLAASHEVETTPPSPWGWASLSVGLALVGVGAGLCVHAELQREEVRDHISNSSFATGISRARAVRLEDAANTNGAVGIAGAVLGGALTITGIVVLAVTGGDPVEHAWRFGVQPGIDGASVSATASF